MTFSIGPSHDEHLLCTFISLVLSSIFQLMLHYFTYMRYIRNKYPFKCPVLIFFFSLIFKILDTISVVIFMLIRLLFCNVSLLSSVFSKKQIRGVAEGVLKDEVVNCLLVVSLDVINTPSCKTLHSHQLVFVHLTMLYSLYFIQQ